MKQKDIKTIKIKNNKLIIEAGSEYGSAAMSAASKIGKAVFDSLVQMKNYVKTNWDLTFGYLINLTKNIYYSGFKEGLKQSNNQFLENNKQNLQAMETLNKSQPGSSDLNLFLGMTCPAAIGVDKIAYKINQVSSKTSYSRTRSSGSSKDSNKQEKRKKRFALMQYNNIVMTISFLSNNTSIEGVRKNLDVDIAKDDFDVYEDKKAMSKVSSKEFIIFCGTLKKIFNMSAEERREKNIVLDVNNKMIDIFSSFISNEKDKKIKKKILDLNISEYINKLCSSICFQRPENIEYLRLANKENIDGKLVKSSKKIKFFKNQMLVLEDVEKNNEKEQDNRTLTEEEHYKFLDAYYIQVSKNAMSYSTISGNSTYLFVKSIYIANLIINSFYRSITDGKDIMADAAKAFKEFKTEAEVLNEKIKSFNSSNQSDVIEVEVTGLEQLLEKFSNDFQKANKEIALVNDVNKKEMLKASSLLAFIEELKKGILESKVEEACNEEIEAFNKLSYEANQIINNNKELFIIYKDVFEDLKISMTSYEKNIESTENSIKEFYNKAIDLQKKIEEFTKSEEVILSKMEDLANQKKDDGENKEDKDQDKDEKDDLGVNFG